MSRSPTTYETVSPQNRDQRLPVESFQTWNIRARVLRRVSQRGAVDDFTVFVLGGFALWIVWVWVDRTHPDPANTKPTPCACSCNQDGGAE
jgi:hypothetical protein